MKIHIKNDVFNIFKRLKQINNDFYLIFDTNKNNYQVYEKSNLIFTLPYKNLDERSLKYVLKMLKISNEEILKEIENHNAQKSKEIEDKIISSALESAEKVLKRS